MAKILVLLGFFSVSGGDRAAAALDRNTWLQWQPSRGFQLGDAIVAAVLRHPGVHPITKRVSQERALNNI
jgi:hypothetical protein